MMLASQNVNSRARQAKFRHTDPRLTEVTYFDKQRYIQPQAEKLGQAASIPTQRTPATVPDDVTGTQPEHDLGAKLAHNGGVAHGLFGSQADTVKVPESQPKPSDHAGKGRKNQPDFTLKDTIRRRVTPGRKKSE